MNLKLRLLFGQVHWEAASDIPRERWMNHSAGFFRLCGLGGNRGNEGALFES